MGTPYYYGIIHPLTYRLFMLDFQIRDSHTSIKNRFYLDEQVKADYYGWGING
jgi:hypothetical protein